jgi:DNA-binding CsgD family transcriptional regulator
MEPLGKIDDFVREIDCALTPEDVTTALAKHVAYLGFEYFTLQVLRTSDGACLSGDITTYPKGWVKRYKEQHYVSHDMVSRYAARSIRPFTWTDIGNFEDFTDDQKRVFQEAAEFGLHSGGSVPLHGPGQISALLAVASSMPPSEFEKLFNACQHELQIIAAYAYDSLFQIGYFVGEAFNLNLSPREAEVMTWTARGKTISEISKILDISATTVRNYVDNAGEKLNTSNKTHATAVAMANGLIVP